jgi:uncharacterized membrane protein
MGVELKDWNIPSKAIMWTLVGLQLLISVPFLNSYAIGLDEPFSIFHAQRNLSDLMVELNAGNNAPLHFILLHYWIQVFGISAIAVRSLSLLFGIISTGVFYKINTTFFSKKFAALSTLFFVFSTFNHYYNLEARNYSLLVLLFLLIVNEQLKIFNQSKSKLVFLRLFCWNALILYTHYLGAYIIAVEGLLFIVFYKKLNKRQFLYLCGVFLLTLAAYFPSLLVFIERISEFSSKGTWVSKPDWTELYGNIIRFLNKTISFFILLLLLLVFGLLNRRFLNKRFFELKGSFLFKYIVLLFLFTYVGMYIFSMLIQPVFIDRYLIYTSPILFIGFVYLIKLVSFENKNLSFLFIIPMILSCYYIPDSNRDADVLSDYVKIKETNNSLILICPPFYDLTFLYHYNKKAFQSIRNKPTYLADSNIQPIYSSNDINLSSEIDEIIYIDAGSNFLYPGNDIRTYLDDNFRLIDSKMFKGDYSVYIYSLN